MSNKIIVPALGESVVEATVSKWLKNAGDNVDSEEPLVELETDKVNVEVPSPLTGVLSQIKVKEGETVSVGALLGIVEKATSVSNNQKTINTKKKIKKESLELTEKVEETTEEEPLELTEKAEETTEEEPLELTEKVEETTEEEPLELTEKVEENILILNQPLKEDKKKSKKNINTLSPSVRKIVAEKKIDTTELTGSGKDGRIVKGDLLDLMGGLPQSSKRKVTHGVEERVKMTKLRITIAKRLKEAQDRAAILTTFNEVDMSNIIKMRKDYNEDFLKTYSVKLGFMSFFVKSCVLALKSYPIVNAEVDGDEIIYKNYYNIGIAVGMEKGLVVPVLKKADEMSFADIERNIFLLSEKAKKGKIAIEDLQGGTFTISNGGIYGSMLSTPILNPPQSGVLGMHNIIERPVVNNNQVVIKPMMYLALSYDHRIIDGKDAVSFLKFVKDCLEEPRRLFLDL